MFYKKKIYFYIIGSLSLILGYAIKENSAGGGLHDFNVLSPHILNFSKDNNIAIKLFFSDGSALIHSPFFYFVSGKITNLLKNFDNFRIFYLLFCLVLPYIHFKILKEKFSSNKNMIYILSFLIFLSPYYRTSAIWTLGDNLSLIFFGLFVFFLVKGEKSLKLPHFIFSLFFLVLCSYTRYYYSTFWILYIYIVYKNFDFKSLIQIIAISFLLAIPAFIYFEYVINNYNFLTLISGYSNFNLIKNIIQILSILSFYILPFIIIDKENFIKFYKKKYNYMFFTFFLLVSLFAIGELDYKIVHGGGVFFKLNNFFSLRFPIIIFFSVFFSILSIIYICKNKIVEKQIQNYILFFCLIISFPINVIYQKYFDPLYLFLIFGLLSSDRIKSYILKDKVSILFVFSYFLFFLGFSFVYYYN